jgi:hypothetical protein
MDMDSRREMRFESDQEVKITFLGEVDVAFAGRIVNVSGRGMCLAVERSLLPGDAVKIEFGEVLALGGVVYCQQAAAGFQVGVTLEQALHVTAELTALLEKLAGRSLLAQP